MAIIQNASNLKVYKGSRKPVNLYYGSNKVKGWHNVTITDAIATFNNTYNDTADVEVKGNTVQDPETGIVYDASGTVTSRNADGTKSITAPIPALRKVGNVTDSFGVKTGKLTRKTGRIENYNGETITTDYISSTGGLDTGATVVYALAEPIEEQYDPVTLPTYYPTTVVKAVDDTPAEMEITATVKVED